MLSPSGRIPGIKGLTLAASDLSCKAKDLAEYAQLAIQNLASNKVLKAASRSLISGAEKVASVFVEVFKQFLTPKSVITQGRDKVNDLPPFTQ